MITSAIFLGGSGAAIIGGLYWKRGTTAGAFASMIVGTLISAGGFALKAIVPSLPFQSVWVVGTSIIVSITSYVLVSLWGPQTSFNMAKMLHRGKYAAKTDEAHAAKKPVKGWKKLVGINDEFTKRDIFVCFLAFALPAVFTVALVTIGISHLVALGQGRPFGIQPWLQFWKVYLLVSLSLAVPFTIWLLIGGVVDVKKLFLTLKTVKRTELDDGRVVALSCRNTQ